MAARFGEGRAFVGGVEAAVVSDRGQREAASERKQATVRGGVVWGDIKSARGCDDGATGMRRSEEQKQGKPMRGMRFVGCRVVVVPQ